MSKLPRDDSPATYDLQPSTTSLDISRYAWLSVATASLTIAFKALGYVLTDSLGVLSDSIESGINLVAATIALVAIGVARSAPDEDHNYGHAKAEYFSSGAEGLFITITAGVIGLLAAQRLVDPPPVNRLTWGLGLVLAASVANLIVARILIRAGRKYRSMALEADGQHLMSDVWTSAGVLVGLGLVGLTGWQILDPLIAIGVAAHIAWVGLGLVRRSTEGLMDKALDSDEVEQIEAVLAGFQNEGIDYHALRTRRAGARSFVSVHILVPSRWSVKQGHDLLERIERTVLRETAATNVFTHLEPIEDPSSALDVELDR